jgi:hypothetical protein
VNASAGSREVRASFVAGERSPCVEEPVTAGCSLRRCSTVAERGTAVDPGRLTASSESLGSVDFKVESGHGTIYQMGEFADDEIVRIAATGSASVSEFDLRVKVPARFRVTRFGNCVVSTDVDIVPCSLGDASPLLEWSGLADGDLMVTLTDTTKGAEASVMTCTFAAAAGNARIPESALAALPHHDVFEIHFGALSESSVDRTSDVTLTALRDSPWLVPGGVRLAF